MQLTMLGNKLLVEPIFDEEKGGVVIPDIAKQKPNFGILRAFGKEFHDQNPEVQKGNRVAFKPYGSAFQSIELNGKEHWIITPEYIVGVVE